MKLIANRESLAKTLSLTYGSIDQKPVVPIWNCFYLKVDNNDMHIYVRNKQGQLKSYQRVSCDETGEFVVPGRMFFETIKNLNCEDIEIEAVENENGSTTVVIKAVGRRKKYSISSYSSKEFKVEQHEKKNPIEINAKLFKKSIELTSFMSDEKSLRKISNGVSIRNDENGFIEIAATNSWALSRNIIKKKAEIDPVIIPKTTCSAFANLSESGNLEIFNSGNYFIITDGTIEISSLLIDTNFPPISQFWENRKEDSFILLDKNELVSSLKILNLYSNVKEKTVVFNIGGKELVLESTSEDKSNQGEELVELDESGIEDLRVGYNASFFAFLCNNIQSDNIKIFFSGERAPAFIEEDEEEEGFEKSFLINALNIQ